MPPNIGAETEAESKRDGYLSIRAEWHSAMWGLSVGFLAGYLEKYTFVIAGVGWLFTRAGDNKVPDYIPYPDEFKKESLYVVAHAAAGLILGLLLRTLMNM